MSLNHEKMLICNFFDFSENVPGKAMKKSGVKYLLAMDIATMDERNLTNYGDTLSGTWTWFDKIKPFGKQKLKIPDSIEIQLRLAFCSHYRNLEELQNDPDFEYICPDLGKFTSSDVSNTIFFKKMCRNDELSWLFTNRLSATR